MGRILLRVVAGAFALVLALSLLSFHPLDPHPFAQGAVGMPVHNLCGVFGASLAGVCETLMGVGAWILPPYILWECFPSGQPRWLRRLAWLVLAACAWTLLGGLGPRLWPLDEAQHTIELRWGGWMGRALWPPARRILGPVGLPVALGALILFAMLVLAPGFTRACGRLLARWFGDRALPWLKPLPGRGARGFLGVLRRPFRLLGRNREVPDLDARDARELLRVAERRKAEEEPVAALEKAERESAEYRKANPAATEPDLPMILSFQLDPTPEPAPALESGETPLVISHRTVTPPEPLPPPTLLRNLPPPVVKPPLVAPRVERDAFGRVVEQQPLGLTEPTPALPLPEPPESGAGSRSTGPLPAGPSTTGRPSTGSVSARLRTGPEPPNHRGPSARIAIPAAAAEDGASPVDRLELPPRRLFDPPAVEHRLDLAGLEATRQLLQQKFNEFKVKGTVTGMQPGPVVTVYEFQPDPGVPVAKVLSLEEDLALGLKAEKVRVDRIPGRALVGIEVPNLRRQIISFREVVDSPAFRDPAEKDGRSLLTLALGKDMAGHPVVADLAKMPHLLIGGSTGSGKSVGVNAMICSLLLRALASEVKLILVDPKMVELGIYEDIPHLWAPVVTDMKEAGRVLKWVVAQMEDRYRRLAMLSVRNLEGFNAKVMEAGGSIDLGDRTPNPRWPERPSVLEPLPYVVVVIDELADLMMVCRADVEDSIARLAQKARAVGVHLILATQRPSVDIVTGVIKANLPSRLSYRVNTKIDSRTILDSGGGEQLLGKGDALFLAPGHARPKRIHAPLLTEEETLRLVEWLKERGKPDYNAALLNAMETDEEAGGESAGDGSGPAGDDIYDRAVAVVKRERKASTSLLQRKLNIGYGRAARLIDRMEDEGIIGADRGVGKPREVLVGEE
jgi:S-DNA-T family DNA segregation ATPase FtsK/SpoIIIE